MSLADRRRHRRRVLLRLQGFRLADSYRRAGARPVPARGMHDGHGHHRGHDANRCRHCLHLPQSSHSPAMSDAARHRRRVLPPPVAPQARVVAPGAARGREPQGKPGWNDRRRHYPGMDSRGDIRTAARALCTQSADQADATDRCDRAGRRHVLARHRSSRARHLVATHLRHADGADLRAARDLDCLRHGHPDGPARWLQARLGRRDFVAHQRSRTRISRAGAVHHHHFPLWRIRHQHRAGGDPCRQPCQ